MSLFLLLGHSGDAVMRIGQRARVAPARLDVGQPVDAHGSPTTGSRDLVPSQPRRHQFRPWRPLHAWRRAPGGGAGHSEWEVEELMWV